VLVWSRPTNNRLKVPKIKMNWYLRKTDEKEGQEESGIKE
jgi:hypothetical protein